MCWASCSLRYWERRTWSSDSLRGDSASAASEIHVSVVLLRWLHGSVSDPGMARVCRKGRLLTRLPQNDCR